MLPSKATSLQVPAVLLHSSTTFTVQQLFDKWLEIVIQHNTNCSDSPVHFSSGSFHHSGSPFGPTTEEGHTETVTTSSGGTKTFSEFEVWV